MRRKMKKLWQLLTNFYAFPHFCTISCAVLYPLNSSDCPHDNFDQQIMEHKTWPLNLKSLKQSLVIFHINNTSNMCWLSVNFNFYKNCPVVNVCRCVDKNSERIRCCIVILHKNVSKTEQTRKTSKIEQKERGAGRLRHLIIEISQNSHISHECGCLKLSSGESSIGIVPHLLKSYSCVCTCTRVCESYVIYCDHRWRPFWQISVIINLLFQLNPYKRFFPHFRSISIKYSPSHPQVRMYARAYFASFCSHAIYLIDYLSILCYVVPVERWTRQIPLRLYAQQTIDTWSFRFFFPNQFWRVLINGVSLDKRVSYNQCDVEHADKNNR